MRKCDGVAERKRRKRETGDESFSTKDGSFLYTFFGPAVHAFLPLRSIQAHAASDGQAGFASHKPLHFRPTGLQIPPVLASPKGPCAAPSQAPSVAARRRRYNTLDLAGKIVCQGRPCPLWIPLPRNPGFFGFFPQRKTVMSCALPITVFSGAPGERTFYRVKVPNAPGSGKR